jgi:UDP-glucose 4-epimerase
VKVATCSADKARKFLNYKTKTTLKESIRLTKDFIKKRGVKKFNYKLPIKINSKITPKTWSKKII